MQLECDRLTQALKPLVKIEQPVKPVQVVEAVQAEPEIQVKEEVPAVKTEPVVDPALRKAVCLRIADLLEARAFPKPLAQELSLDIERNIRARDPSMSHPYASLCHSMLRDIHHLSIRNYTKVIAL